MLGSDNKMLAHIVKMTLKRLFALLPILLVSILTFCRDKKDTILYDKNFDDGKWLLVVENHVEKTLFVIDDEKVLKANPDGLRLGPNAYCGGTTCDGFITLYKNGELVDTKEFLSKSDLLETDNIKKAYKIARTECTAPDQMQFKQTWDSLETIKNTYPTQRHIQPEDKDIICFYQYN